MEEEDGREQKQAPRPLAFLDLVEVARPRRHDVSDIIPEFLRSGQFGFGDMYLWYVSPFFLVN
jgi:hypothetical protein